MKNDDRKTITVIFKIKPIIHFPVKWKRSWNSYDNRSAYRGIKNLHINCIQLHGTDITTIKLYCRWTRIIMSQYHYISKYKQFNGFIAIICCPENSISQICRISLLFVVFLMEKLTHIVESSREINFFQIWISEV